MFAHTCAVLATLPKTRAKRILLAPSRRTATRYFTQTSNSPSRHRKLLFALQRFRGSHYFADGALQENELTSDGRHVQEADSDSWHLLTLDDHDRIMSCARYLENTDLTFESTGASQSALAQNPVWNAPLRTAVNEAIQSAQMRGMRFAELGGWCVSRDCRNSTQAVRTVLSMYALGEILGGTVGLSAATMRHSSSTILQKLGGTRLKGAGEPLPSYMEPKYGCEMELLQFDTSRPASRYAETISALSIDMRGDVEVLTPSLNLSFSSSVKALAHAVGYSGPKALVA